jgi:hypothetical protein
MDMAKYMKPATEEIRCISTYLVPYRVTQGHAGIILHNRMNNQNPC